MFLISFINNKNKKKVIENAVIIIILGIIVIIAGGSFFKKSESKEVLPEKSVEKSNGVLASTLPSEDSIDIEKKLETLLSKVEGAGKVEVMVTYVSGKELVPAYDIKKAENDTQEKDSGGGTRSIKQDDSENKVVYKESQGGIREPVILKELQPEVKGVVIVADGASDLVVREGLCRAVQVLLDVEVHRIQVLERKK